MAEIVKIGLFAVVGVLIAIQLKSQKPEYAAYMGLALAIVIFSFVLEEFKSLVSEFTLLKRYMQGGEEYLAVLLKVLGITYICEFSAGICKEAGYGAVAEQIEILGKMSVMFAGLPILMAVVEQMQAFVG